MENSVIESGKINIPKEKKKASTNEVESLTIYGKYLDLISYTNKILLKFPKFGRFALCTQIANTTYDGMKQVISAHKFYTVSRKLDALNLLDIDLKMLKVLIRVAYKNKYITLQNYHAWSAKLFHIGNLLGGWIISCQKR